MAVALRLNRKGSKDRPYYKIVAVDQRKRRDGRYIEQLGTYNPLLQGVNFEIDLEKADKWLKVGARPSETVASIIRKARSGGGAEPVESQPAAKPPEPEPKQQPAEAPAEEPKAEAPAEEPKAEAEAAAEEAPAAETASEEASAAEAASEEPAAETEDESKDA